MGGGKGRSGFTQGVRFALHVLLLALILMRSSAALAAQISSPRGWPLHNKLTLLVNTLGLVAPVL